MKIGIFKPYKKIIFNDISEDYAAWSFEIIQLINLFVENNHQLYILSETNLKEDEFKNIKIGSFSTKYDRIFIIGGYFDNDIGIIEKCRKITKRLDFMLTDLRLDAYRHDLFDNIYDQMILAKHKYNGMPELAAYKHKFNNLQQISKSKKIEYYFGGGERGRLTDFLEYVWRPDCVLHAKSMLLKFDNRVSHSCFLKQLQFVKYSIVIADTDYNKNAHVTLRYYENILADVVSFVDVKYDVNEKFIKMTDWRRVKTYNELRDKMNILNKDTLKYATILQKQRNEIKSEYITGKYTYNLLK